MQSKISILRSLHLIYTNTMEHLGFVVGKGVSAELFMSSARIQVFQGHLIAELVLIQEVHHVGLVVPQCLDSMEDIHGPLVPEHLTDNADGTKCATAASPIQAVHNRATFPAVVLLLPLVHLADELQEGALGHRCIPVHWPAQELELLYHSVSILRSGCVINTEYPADDVLF